MIKLTPEENLYFIDLFKNYGITSLTIDETGVFFKDEEISNFLIPEDDPEISLNKLLDLQKITHSIYYKIGFNYTITLSTNNNETTVVIKFHEEKFPF